MLVYATSDDLAAWTGEAAPTNATQLLRTASLAIREVTKTAFYATDDTGLPTDPNVAQAFNDACCAHAAALAAFDYDPTTGGVYEAGLVESSVKIGSASVTAADGDAAIQAAQGLLGGLAPEALRVLRLEMPWWNLSPWLVG